MLRLFLFAVAVTVAAAPDAMAMTCTLNGHTVPQDCFANNHTCGQDSGRMVCMQGDEPFGAWNIEQGKHIGAEELYDHAGNKTQRSVDADGKVDGTMKKFSPAGILRWQKDFVHGQAQGQDRTYYPTGKPQEINWWDNGHIMFSVEYDNEGNPTSLSCTAKPYVDEARALCGFNGKPSVVRLSIPGRPDTVRTVSYLNGVLQSDSVGARGGGPLISQETVTGDNRVTKDYFPDGKLQLESSYNKNRKLDGMQTEYSQSGQIIRKTLWDKGEKVQEDLFFLNGQKKSHQDRVRQGDHWLVADKNYYDNGKIQSEGSYIDDLPVQEHRGYNENGTLVIVDIYDDKGNIQREKKWDDAGKLLSDDAVFEDGSRKSFSVK